MYGIYGNIYHQYTPNVSIYTIHGSYGYYYWDVIMTYFTLSLEPICFLSWHAFASASPA